MKYKIGIIGLGVGEKHIIGYNKHKACQVVLVCDFCEKKLNTVSKKHTDLKITKDPDEILLDPSIDIVSIASYDNYHYEQIIKALNNNKHVFVEKPLCITPTFFISEVYILSIPPSQSERSGLTGFFIRIILSVPFNAFAIS